MTQLFDSVYDLHRSRLELLPQLDRPKLGFSSIYMPEELLYAAGIAPFRLTGETRTVSSEASSILSNNFCSYILSCFSEGLDEVYSFADGHVFLDTCDMRKRLYEVWQKHVGGQFYHLLELPKDTKPASFSYYRFQLKRLLGDLEEHYGVTIDEEALRGAIRLCNESRRLLRTASRMRNEGILPIQSMQLLELVKAGSAGMKEEFNRRLSAALREYEGVEAPASPNGCKVLISGSYFDNPSILEVIERTGARIVCEDLSTGFNYFAGEINEDAEDPLSAIADYYLGKAVSARMIDADRRAAHIRDLVEEHEIDAVLYVSLKFCDTNLMDYPYIRHSLAQQGIPVLFIESEQHMTNIQSIRTRIQTFFETRIS
ncbi:2-hydroxyacyl-CoA dehydratase subunit D [Paenibacillus tepidiphilus]|uniref:2-hydroxyacyl-CoA dehydratase subunit D n=1 Tax=Paenibacillus tepidiphilus TaxID=2608683 RepID=UPI00123ABAA2|nr:2-hydroxyacyl-CoA dehydratase family protein [Paenibacillus tepidiphilus]